MHRRTLRHIRAIAPKPQVTVKICLGGRNTRGVGDADGFLGRRVLSIAGGRFLHSERDARVCVGLVGGGVGSTGEGPGEGCGGAAGVGGCAEEEGDTHGGGGDGEWGM
jgi:hypothetical protein